MSSFYEDASELQFIKLCLLEQTALMGITQLQVLHLEIVIHL